MRTPPLELSAPLFNEPSQVRDLFAGERLVCVVEVTEQEYEVVIIAESVGELVRLVRGRFIAG